MTDYDSVPVYYISHITEMFDISTYEINFFRIRKEVDKYSL